MQNTRFEIGSQEEYLIFTERCCSSQLRKKSEYTEQIQKCQSVCIADIPPCQLYKVPADAPEKKKSRL